MHCLVGPNTVVVYADSIPQGAFTLVALISPFLLVLALWYGRKRVPRKGQSSPAPRYREFLLPSGALVTVPIQG
jgi:hypothetical protein